MKATLTCASCDGQMVYDDASQAMQLACSRCGGWIEVPRSTKKMTEATPGPVKVLFCVVGTMIIVGVAMTHHKSQPTVPIINVSSTETDLANYKLRELQELAEMDRKAD